MLIYDKIYEILKDKDSILQNVSASTLTTFKTGGTVDYLVKPSTIDQLIDILKLLREVQLPYFVIGKGSNILVSDKGYKGVFISLDNCYNKVEVSDEIVKVGASVTLKELTKVTLDNCLSGFEFACGIPGSIGGATFMNAGAYGSEMKEVIVSAEVLDENLNLKTLVKDELNLSYRNSVIREKNYIVLSVRLKLYKKSKELILDKIEDLQRQRNEKQPIELPSAGSTFKRPEGHYVGKLITECNLKGYSLGGASVSKKHAGFIVNSNNASATDIINLIEYIQKIVSRQKNVNLEPEVIILNR